ncbi:MAG: hypothetical protein HPY85_11620 [Anaerolineae bacterium]|nr:hypothetical protein [Anaerolineae bacterium]
MRFNTTHSQQHKTRQWILTVASVVLLLLLPAGLALGDGVQPPDGRRSGDEFRQAAQEENRDLTRGMMYMGGLMVLVVVAGTLRILALDRANRPHLIQPRKKRELPDATVKKTPLPVQEPSAADQAESEAKS